MEKQNLIGNMIIDPEKAKAKVDAEKQEKLQEAMNERFNMIANKIINIFIEEHVSLIEVSTITKVVLGKINEVVDSSEIGTYMKKDGEK